MAIEIERKFLVVGDGWRQRANSVRRFRQFYLSDSGPASVRVRIVDGTEARLTIKSASGGMSRSEFEYAIPIEDARELATLAVGVVVEKIRHVVPHAGHAWEVDEFAGANAGLILAEVELKSADEVPELPPWIGAEVTDDRRYYSGSLAQQPFTRW